MNDIICNNAVLSFNVNKYYIAKHIFINIKVCLSQKKYTNANCENVHVTRYNGCLLHFGICIT